jgi:hypothetical protein
MQRPMFKRKLKLHMFLQLEIDIDPTGDLFTRDESFGSYYILTAQATLFLSLSRIFDLGEKNSLLC